MKSQRFSTSSLWDLQIQAYNQFGPQAWIEKGVPFYLTSNPLTAQKYANVVFGYLRDCLSSYSITPLDYSKPLYIFDLGAGAGRFGYLFLKSLFELLSENPFKNIKICYVMTDFNQSNIDVLRTHPLLEKYIKNESLDFALYHHRQQDALHLIESNTILSAKKISNPIVLICNYFFDTIPQDLFFIKKGKLYEGRIQINKNSYDNDVESTISHLECSYEYSLIKNKVPYYQDIPALQKVLAEYAQTFDEIPFLLPLGACQVLDYFLKLSNNRMLLVAGDQGVVTEEQIWKWGEPKISKHGSFSIPVSYHALAKFFKYEGGISFLTSDSDTTFVVMAAAIAKGKEDNFPETKIAFQQNLDNFEPKDYWFLIEDMLNNDKHPSLNSIIAAIKLGNWDPLNFYAFFETIQKYIPHATDQEKNRILYTIKKIWSNFFPISKEEAHFAMNLGVLCYQLKDYSSALFFFQEASKMGLSNQMLHANIAACLRVIRPLA